jgi:hypothetical protein
MAWLVALDDLEDLHQRRIGPHDGVAQQGLDLAIAASFGQRDHPAEPFEQIVPRHERTGVETVDRGAKHDLDEAVDMAAGAIDRERHQPLQLKPAAKHHIMLALVGPMLLDRGEKHGVIWRALSDRLDHPIDRRVTAMLIVDVDRAEKLKISATKP